MSRPSPRASGRATSTCPSRMGGSATSFRRRRTPGGLALEQVSSGVLAGTMFCMGTKSPQLLSRTREHTLDALSETLAQGPRQKGADLIAGVPAGSPLGNALGVGAWPWMLRRWRWRCCWLWEATVRRRSRLSAFVACHTSRRRPRWRPRRRRLSRRPSRWRGWGAWWTLGAVGGFRSKRQLSCWAGCRSLGPPTTGTNSGGRSRWFARPSRPPRRLQAGSSGPTRRQPFGTGHWGAVGWSMAGGSRC